jgi:hypothetical protein
VSGYRPFLSECIDDVFPCREVAYEGRADVCPFRPVVSPDRGVVHAHRDVPAALTADRGLLPAVLSKGLAESRCLGDVRPAVLA